LEEKVGKVEMVRGNEQVNVPGMAQGQVAINLQSQAAAFQEQNRYGVFLKKPAEPHRLCGIGQAPEGVVFEAGAESAHNGGRQSFAGIAAEIGIDQRRHPVTVNSPEKLRPGNIALAQALDLLGFLRLGVDSETGKKKTHFPGEVRLHKGADLSHEAITFYPLHEVPGKADHVLEQLEMAFNSLSENPHRGAYPKELLSIGVREYREIFFKPCRIIYRVMENNVYVLLIADGRRDMETLLQRRLLA
jgi:toxin ParE1/3/4